MYHGDAWSLVNQSYAKILPPVLFVLSMAYFVHFTSYLFVDGDGGPFHPAKYYFLPAACTWDGDNWDLTAFSQFNLTSQTKN